MSIPQKKEGPDGKLYYMGNHGDYDKFRTLTDEEMEEEERMNREMAATLKMMSGKSDARGNPRKQKASSFVPPHLGTSNRSRKIEKRAWDKKLNGSPEPELATGGEQPISTIKGKDTGGVSSEDRLMHAVATMQEKYTENMSVIEQLFSEKMQMEKRMAALEDELERTRREQTRSDAMRRKVQAKDRLNQTAPGLAQGRGFNLDADVEEELAGRRGRKAGAAGGRPGPGLSSTTPNHIRRVDRDPDDVAIDDMIEDDLYGDEDMPDDDLAPPAYVESPPRSRSGSDDVAASTVRVSAADMASMFAEDALKGSVAADRSRGLGGGRGNVRGRSSDGRRGEGTRDSATRRSHSLTRGLGSTGATSTGPSASLQADTDRYAIC
jgi:hypothetical protein